MDFHEFIAAELAARFPDDVGPAYNIEVASTLLWFAERHDHVNLMELVHQVMPGGDHEDVWVRARAHLGLGPEMLHPADIPRPWRK